METKFRTITPDMLADDPFRPPHVDFEKGMSSAPVFALALIAVNAAAYVWELKTGALSNIHTVIASGAIYGDKVFGGQSWRLLTGMFLHGSFGHLFGNCLALYMVGLAAEQAWGRWRSLLIYFVSGLAASFASAFMETRPSIGASGAVFGLAGAVMAFFFRYGNSFYARNRRVGNFLIAWGLLQLWLGSLDRRVDNWAHLAGFISGAVIGYAAPTRFFRRNG